jgi:hypothetical protein
MALSKKYVKDICLQGQGSDACRFLHDEPDPQSYKVKYICTKCSLDRKIIDEEVTEHMQECHQKGIDPFKESLPLGDNCKGYLPLMDLEQGYDVSLTVD